MLPAKIAFVDIETTGGRSFYDRIIEIGILRLEDNKLTRTYHTLINPEAYLPREIEYLTGISGSELENAPTFRSIKDDILEVLDGCYFVAHNVRFDYGFLKNEFQRTNTTFSKRHFCTVKLSRLLYPNFRHHNLDAIIERFNFKCNNRHRAFDDAKILFDFYLQIQKEFTIAELDQAIGRTLKKPSLPLKLPYSSLENLPDTPGAYMFYSESGMPLYIGKSINLKNRILSHFSSDIRSATEMNISQQVTNIETIQTAGELGALLLEQQLIKKYLPVYNKKSRFKQELIAIKSRINKDGYKEAFLEPITKIAPPSDSPDKNIFLGFFRSRRQAKAYLSDLSEKYTLCEKLLGLENTKGACFGYRLEKCNGGCVCEEKYLIYNLRFDMAFNNSKILPWPYSGPIVIEENEFSGKKEYFIIDNWCYLGNVVIDEFDQKKNDTATDMVFDLETYKIIKTFIKNPANKKKIRVLDKKDYVMLQG